MKLRVELILFLFVSIFLACQSIFASDQEVRISDADEEWTVGAAKIEQDVIESPESSIKLPVEAAACGADEVLTFGMEAASREAVDSSSASIKIPVEAAVCQADEVWTNDLTSVDVGSELSANSKAPVLFIPGILGTEINKNNVLTWLDIDRLVNPSIPESYSDNFLDQLAFSVIDGKLLPIDSELSLANVIKRKTYSVLGVVNFNYDYTEGLINQFVGLGYAEGRDFFTFPYDWRYGVSGVYPDRKTNSILLKEKIDELAKSSPTGKVDVIAHSLGGLVVKKYAMENDEPKINKLVFLGVPNLGSPDAMKTLLIGSDFRVPGLNRQKVYEITQNMPVAYDLLPGQQYFSVKGSFVYNLNKFPFGSKMDYADINKLFRDTGLNGKELEKSALLHTPEFDNYDVRTKNIDAYNIIGCKAPTLAGLNYQITDTGLNGFSVWRKPISGDDTVPRESAESIAADPEKTFYSINAAHGKIPSFSGIRQKIANIITGSKLNEGTAIYKKSQIDQKPSLCKLRGTILIVLSPVNITAVDQAGNVTGIDSEGNTRYEIPGSGFDEINGHKYLYLPDEDGQNYNIKLKGTDTGTFTLIKQKIEGDEVKSAEVFKDIAVTPEFDGSLRIDGASARIVPTGGAVINPTSAIEGGAAGDVVPPSATTTINGQMGKEGFYRGDVSITLSAEDFAPAGAAASGVYSISYRLDGGAAAAIQTASTTINVAEEGKHSLTFYSSDKLGNKEEPKTIDFIIDKTAPEISFVFDPDKKDLTFSARDNHSASSSIDIADKDGSVVAADEAGNTTRLSFGQKDRRQSAGAQLNEISFNGNPVDMTGNQIILAWSYGNRSQAPRSFADCPSLPKMPDLRSGDGSLSYLLQQARLKDGSFIAAAYSGGKTQIYEYKDKKYTSQTFGGLKLVDFFIEVEKLKWSF